MRHNYDRHPSVADSVVTQDTFNDRAPRPLNTHHLRNSLGRIGVVDIGYSEWNEDGRIRGLHRTHAISHRSYYYLKACTFVRAKKKKHFHLFIFASSSFQESSLPSTRTEKRSCSWTGTWRKPGNNKEDDGNDDEGVATSFFFNDME